MGRWGTSALAPLLCRAAGDEDFDPMTVADLAAYGAFRVRTFQSRCKAAGVTAKACVDFVRCLRLVLSETRWNPQSDLSHYSKDYRTVRRLVRQGGLDRPSRPSVAQFLRAAVPSLGRDLQQPWPSPPPRVQTVGTSEQQECQPPIADGRPSTADRRPSAVDGLTGPTAVYQTDCTWAYRRIR